VVESLDQAALASVTHIDMSTKSYTVACLWDAEAGMWYVAETDVPGLATEAATLEEMERKLLQMIPELLELNVAGQPRHRVPFELIARKHEFAPA
jgi:predicted RNase H-like HicB family nuclease